jgi:FkbM family methyltransferase
MKYNRQHDLPYPQPWEYVLQTITEKIDDGVYVDVGANDGLIVSNTAYMEFDMGWRGICIEPNPNAFKRLINNRNCIKYNCCISDVDCELEFLSVTGYAEMLSCIKSQASNEHINRINSEILKNGGSVENIIVKSVKLQKILDDNNLYKIDYLSIDTEGSELSVLNSIDFDKTYIKFISAENSSGNDLVKNFLTQKGFRFLDKIFSDEIYMNI